MQNRNPNYTYICGINGWTCCNETFIYIFGVWSPTQKNKDRIPFQMNYPSNAIQILASPAAKRHRHTQAWASPERLKVTPHSTVRLGGFSESSLNMKKKQIPLPFFLHKLQLKHDVLFLKVERLPSLQTKRKNNGLPSGKLTVKITIFNR